jgi:hypothetical protein
VSPSDIAASFAARILNAAWMVRHYARGRYSRIHAAERAAALLALGLVCREAFNACDDFETILGAIVDGLAPREERRF